jgi:hypothetical protein
MNYFNRRNNYQVEYSGYEEASENLRKRLYAIAHEYVNFGPSASSYGISRPYKIKSSQLSYSIQKEFPSESIFNILETGKFYKVFTVTEILWDLLKNIDTNRALKAYYEIAQAFILSGSVYGMDPKTGRIILIPDEDLAKKLRQTQDVLAPYEHAHKIFFEAVGNLFGRRSKPKDVVRDVYVAAEEYLKHLTGESQYSAAVKNLNKKGVLGDEQKVVLEKLYAFRSNTKGTTHAGDKDEAGEAQAVWFIDTMSAQLRFVNGEVKN